MTSHFMKAVLLVLVVCQALTLTVLVVISDRVREIATEPVEDDEKTCEVRLWPDQSKRVVIRYTGKEQR